MAFWLWAVLYVIAVLAIVPLAHVGGRFPDGVILYGRMHAIRPRLALGGARVIAALALAQPAALSVYADLAHLQSPVYSLVLMPLFERLGILPAIPFLRVAIVLGFLALFVAILNSKRNRPIPLALAAVAISPLTTPWYGLWAAFAGAWAHRRAFTLAWWVPAILWPLYLIYWY